MFESRGNLQIQNPTSLCGDLPGHQQTNRIPTVCGCCACKKALKTQPHSKWPVCMWPLQEPELPKFPAAFSIPLTYPCICWSNELGFISSEIYRNTVTADRYLASCSIFLRFSLHWLTFLCGIIDFPGTRPK